MSLIAEFDVTCEPVRQELLAFIDEGGCYRVKIEPLNKITSTQFKGLHVWFRECANYLNQIGQYRRGLSKINAGEIIEYPWTEDAFKAFYKDVLFEYRKALSTKDQSTKDPDVVIDIIVRYFADKGASLPVFCD